VSTWVRSWGKIIGSSKVNSEPCGSVCGKSMLANKPANEKETRWHATASSARKCNRAGTFRALVTLNKHEDVNAAAGFDRLSWRTYD